MISGTAALTLLATIVIGGLVFWLIWWFLGVCGLPEPFNKVARILIALAAIMFLINVLLSLGGHPLFSWR